MRMHLKSGNMLQRQCWSWRYYLFYCYKEKSVCFVSIFGTMPFKNTDLKVNNGQAPRLRRRPSFPVSTTLDVQAAAFVVATAAFKARSRRALLPLHRSVSPPPKKWPCKRPSPLLFSACVSNTLVVHTIENTFMYWV